MDQDFFGTRPDATSFGDDVDTFAKAISSRSVLNPSMNPISLAPIKPKAPLTSTNLMPSSSFGFLEPNGLTSLINSSSALIIDIRPHAAYLSARIPTALSLSVPSTLLKRPLFSLDRLGAMLPSSSSRARFKEWSKFSTIVVYDVDSAGSPYLPEGNNILGLLRKFSNDTSYSGNTLLWLKGGFQRVWRERRDLVDFRPPESEAEDDGNDSGSLKTTNLPYKAFSSGTTTRNSLAMSSPQKTSTLSLRANAPQMSDKPSVTSSSIPFNPFFDTIRQNIELTQGVTERIPLRLPKRVRRRIDDLPFEWLRKISRRADVQPENSISSDGDDSTSSVSETESYRRHPPESSPRLLPPGIHHEYPPSADHKPSSNASKQQPTPPPPDQAVLEEGMEALANQFYQIELAEQRRLMGVMKHHSAESGVVSSKTHSDRKRSVESTKSSAASGSRPGSMSFEETEHTDVDAFTLGVFTRPSPPSATSPDHSGDTLHSTRARKTSNLDSVSSGPTVPPSISESDSDRGRGSKSAKQGNNFPYSITAGVEKGAKNRYRHIWPFEHARVRLHLRRHSPPPKSSRSQDHRKTVATLHSAVPFPHLPPSSAPSIRSSGPLTGPINSLSSSTSTGASISRSSSDATRSPRSARMKNRRGAKPSFGAGGLGGISTPSFNFSSPALTAPVLSGFSASAIGGSALKPSFTHMRAPPPAAGSGGETTESEHEHEDSEKEESRSEEHDDYVNASYVQPLCTTRRYIATQGPLEATFVDFWTLVYQQNVHVIVMLTREIEGSMIKCHPYWKDEVFGPLRLKLVSVEGNVDEGKDDDIRRKASSGGFFSPPPVVPDRRGKNRKGTRDLADAIIKRTFLLSHIGYPDIPPRKVVQLQYLDWPDMNVPEDPRGVLGLIQEVDQAVTEAMHLDGQGEEETLTAKGPSLEKIDAGVPPVIRPSLSTSRSDSEESLNRYTGIANNAIGRKHSPVLLHCSAGVGRTGGFIAVDAVLDGVRRELRKQKKGSQRVQDKHDISAIPDAMDVDQGTAAEDGHGNWNWIGDTNVGNTTDVHTIAIPANNRGNILHVPVHHPLMVRRSYYLSSAACGQESNDDLLTPTAPLSILHASQDTSTDAAVGHSTDTLDSSLGSCLRTPMQVDENFSNLSNDEHRPTYPRQSSTTRMWAESVSDQTGSHGTAFRVDEAIRNLYSQDRLSEWDVPDPILEAQKGGGSVTRTSSGDPWSTEVNVLGSSGRATSLPPGDDVATKSAHNNDNKSGSGKGAILEQRESVPTAFPLSSIDSASSSDSSYGFQSGFKGAPHHHSGHHTTGSLPYGESALTSSTGTSLSSLQSLSGSAMPKSSTTQAIGGYQLPALNLRGEEARLRTWSAPDARRIHAETGELNEIRRQIPFSSSPYVIGDHTHVAKSPSPFSLSIRGTDRDEFAPLPPPSRSLSPPNRSDISSGALNPHSSSSSMELAQGSRADLSMPTLTGSRALALSASNFNFTLSESHTNHDNQSSLNTKPPFVPSVLIDSESTKSVNFQGASVNADRFTSAKDVLTSGPNADLSYPRALHNDQSPQALSNLAEPVMEVLQDMREQRMSLCQSLRQYVFVHAAVIEGALMIVDEEREREKKEMGMDIDDSAAITQSMSQTVPSNASSLGHARRTDGVDSITCTPSTGKRVASPTELPKEDKKGDQMLFKRPSIKKKLAHHRDRSP